MEGALSEIATLSDGGDAFQFSPEFSSSFFSFRDLEKNSHPHLKVWQFPVAPFSVIQSPLGPARRAAYYIPLGHRAANFSPLSANFHLYFLSRCKAVTCLMF